MSLFEMLDVARQAAMAQQPAESWQPDPTARHEQRWWDGERWTAWVADGGRQGSDPVALGEEAPTWSERWDNPTIRAWRDEVLGARLGVTPAELAALAGEPGGLEDAAAVQKNLALMRTPREQVQGWSRNVQSVLLNRRNAAALARGDAVALVHCGRCHAVVDLTWDDSTKRYRCPARHRFMLDDVTLVAPDGADATRAALAAQPPHKGVRL